MFGSVCEKKLIKTKAQKIAKIDIQPSRSKLADPKVEQSEISQDPVEEFHREGAIGRFERGTGQQTGNDRIREFRFFPPCSQRGESNSAS